MKKIPSFTIDHIHLLRGIYVSRKDYLGDHVVTTFDIRMKEPGTGHRLRCVAHDRTLSRHIFA